MEKKSKEQQTQKTDTQNTPLSNNMRIYKQLMSTPETAKKTIGGGRLKGFTDINPMYRIQKLTEVFGPAGIGWYIDDVEYTTRESGQETALFCSIKLFVKVDGEWSRPIVGIGGSMLVAKEKNGMFLSDEAYKMAYTDAISIACKSLGMCHDIYYSKDRTKYDTEPEGQESETMDEYTPETLLPVLNGINNKEDLAGFYNDILGGNDNAPGWIKKMVGKRLNEINKEGLSNQVS